MQGEGSGLVFVGDAAFVRGARPDVQAAFPSLPNSDRAGWGYMLLSNMLPNRGSISVTISAYAVDHAGLRTLLGSRRIIAANGASLAPFGTIDTPGQGQTVSGVIANFGWALTPAHTSIPTDGSTIDVYIDNIFVGHPTYGLFRAGHRDAFSRSCKLQRCGRPFLDRHDAVEQRASHDQLGRARQRRPVERASAAATSACRTDPDAMTNPESRTFSRRSLVGLTTLGAFARAATADAQIRQPPMPTRPLALPEAELKLVRRVTNGVTPADLAEVQGMGYSAYLGAQLQPTLLDDTMCNDRLTVYTSLALPPQHLYTLDSTTVQRELIEATIVRAIYSRRQLLERIVEFWNDHFNTNINTVGILRILYDRDTIRPNALGSFGELLRATAGAPAMLQYLNNAQSTRTAPNQNYARELMELHTLGVDGGYTQQDVMEVARCFTGWRYNGNTGDARAGTFFYDSTRHDNNAKLVLGNTIPAGGGMNDGILVLRILAGTSQYRDLHLDQTAALAPAL